MSAVPALVGDDDVALPFLADILGAGARGVGALFAAEGTGLVLAYLALARRGRGRPATTGLVLGPPWPASATC